MTSRVRSWIALGLFAFIGNAAFRPAVAAAAPAAGPGNDEEPTVTPYGMPARRAQPTTPPAAESSAPPAQTTMTAPPANAAPPTSAPPPPANATPAPPGYPAGPYPGYPPPGYPPGYAPPYPYAYPPPGYPPPQLTKVHRPRRGLVTGGAITFGVSWGIAATFSFLLSTDNNCSNGSNCNGVDYLWIPVAGPLVVAADSNSDSTGVLLLWSAAQAAGVIMFIAGMVGHDVMEYRYAKNGPTLQLGPLIARDANGLGLIARW